MNRHEQFVEGAGTGFGRTFEMIAFPTGDAPAIRAKEMTVQIVEAEEDEPGFVLIAMRIGDKSLYVGNDPLRARQIAAAILIAADELDGGRGRQ